MTAGSPANRAARCHHASVYSSPLLALHTALLQPRPPSFSLSIPTTPGDSHSSFHSHSLSLESGTSFCYLLTFTENLTWGVVSAVARSTSFARR